MTDKPDGLDCTVQVEEDILKSADLVVTVGGDGTLISYAKKAAENGLAVVGVNAGRLGFLTDIESDNLELLEKIIKGEYKTENRMMLQVEVVENGKTVSTTTALNDVIVSAADVARLADIDVLVGEDTISYRADGIIVSTPTGSTAYSMSAGGPIIDPAVRCFNITPICSHSLTARPIIISADDVIKIRISEASRTNAYVGIDGIRYDELSENRELIIKKCGFDSQLINISGKTIFKTLSMKF